MNLTKQIKSTATKLAILLASVSFITSCDDNEETTAKSVAVQFSTTAVTVSESATEQTYTINFAEAAQADATFEIAIENTNVAYATDYTTNPNGSSGNIAVSVTKGQTSAQFRFTPVNNNQINEDVRKITFTLGNFDGPLEAGTQASLEVTLTDDEGPTAVNFANSSSSVAEGTAAGLDVTLPLTNNAAGAGQIIVNLASTNATYGTHFTTQPAAVDGKITIVVAFGDANKSFKVIPINNDDVNAARVINFTIETATGGVNKGTNLTHTFTITDDETPSAATFAVAEGSALELETAGANVTVNLAPQTTGSGTLELTLTSTTATYGTHYTTEPAAVNNKVTIAVANGVTIASFKIIPIENTEVNAARDITFAMTASTGVVTYQNGTSSSYTHSIKDDDAVMTIADLRAMYGGSGQQNIVTSAKIQGIVTSSNPQVNNNNIFIQDATAGIAIRFSAANNNAIKRGDEITIQLFGARFTTFNGLLQVENTPNARAILVDENNTLPTPEVVTLVEFNQGLYEGMLVRVNNVGFVDANGTLTLSGSRTISDGSTTSTVRTESGAPFSNVIMPYGVGSIVGIASDFNGAQIIPMVAEDIFANSPLGTINFLHAISNFGSVNNAAVSAEQTLTVSGTQAGATPMRDVVITASANFQVSLTSGSGFAPTATVPAANLGSPTTVYVRFAPTTGFNQPINGTITLRSLGSPTQSFSVAGTEAGNAEADLMLTENFNYGTTTGNLIDVATGAWLLQGTATATPIQYGLSNLSFTGYNPSNIGGSVTIGTSGQDLRRAFTGSPINTGVIYASFLMNVTSAQTTGDYFINFSDGGTSNFFSRFFVKSDATLLRFGMSYGSGSATYSTNDYAVNTTYLVVIKYDFTNNSSSFYVLNSVVTTEPSSPALSATGTAFTGSLSSISLRQGTASNAAVVNIDGIRVAKTWAALFE
ncbi:MAG: DUF5689 domain-containing protein [Cyclobacteriaceae bacterium]|nr:DUF5689 domain-containing protein [Cytophagales bacterium]MCZ8328237.1 DUF5689 domain-containing protein [Cyclobacteriaceae bacterium]